MEKYVIGIDIGGTNTAMGIVDKHGIIHSDAEIKTVVAENNKSWTFEDYIDNLCEHLMPQVEKVGGLSKIQGIGVGAPNANYYNGTIENAANLPWKGVIDLVSILSEKTGIRKKNIIVSNDADAAAMGEYLYGGAKGMNNFIVITLGTGLGSGIFVDGKILYGFDSFAGELGHTTVVPLYGRKCGCGRYGCLETYCSATGITRSILEYLPVMGKGTKQALRYHGEPFQKYPIILYEDAKNGEEYALEIFERTGEILGKALANFVAFSAPGTIFLFGGLANAGDLLLDPVCKHMNDNLLMAWKDKIKVCISELNDVDDTSNKKNSAAILGAAALGWEEKEYKNLIL